MKEIKTSIELQEAIRNLEADYLVEEKALKAKMHATYEAIQPLNFIKSTLQQVAGSEEIRKTLLNSTIGLSIGYLSEKALENKTISPIQKIAGSIVILGITEALTHHPNELKAIGKNFFGLLKFGINKINTLHDIDCEYNY